MEFKLLANSIGSFSSEGVYGTDRLLEIYFLTVMQRGSEDRCSVAGGNTHIDDTGDSRSTESSGQTHSSTQAKTLFVHTRIKVCNRETGGGQLA